MNRKGEKAQHSVIAALKIAAVVFTAACIWLKFSESHPVLPLVCLALLTTLLMCVLVWYMVTTGRVRAKGAKRRRSDLLPFMYQKKYAPDNSVGDDAAPAY